MTTKVILNPHGIAVVLSKVRHIYPVTLTWSNYNNYSGVHFNVHYNDKEYTTFDYPYTKYVEDKDTLFKKVEKIRLEILKLINDGVEVKEVNVGISLKKEDSKEEIGALPPSKPVKK